MSYLKVRPKQKVALPPIQPSPTAPHPLPLAPVWLPAGRPMLGLAQRTLQTIRDRIAIQRQWWKNPATMGKQDVQNVKANLAILATLQPKDKLSVLKDGNRRALFKREQGGGPRRLHQAARRLKKGESIDTLTTHLSLFMDNAKTLLDNGRLAPEDYFAATAGLRNLQKTYSGKQSKAQKFNQAIGGRLVDVLVAGAGPAGLASAIEARLAGANVSVIELRDDQFNRDNVLQLDKSTLALLKRLGVYEALFSEEDAEGRDDGIDAHIPIRALQQGLLDRALELGITVEYHAEVAELTPVAKSPGKSIATIHQVEFSKGKGGQKKKKIVGSKTVTFDLFIAAYGAGTSRQTSPELLGIDIEERSKKKAYVAIGLFEAVGSRDDLAAQMMKGNKQIKDRGLEEAAILGGIPLYAQKVHYVLGLLTDEDEKAARKEDLKAGGIGFGRTDWVSAAVERLGLSYGMLGKVRDAFWLAIQLQQAERFANPELGAILIGDAAATPHPGSGSGVNTAFNMVGPVGQVVHQYIKSAVAEERAKVLAAYDKQSKKETDKLLDKAKGFF